MSSVMRYFGASNASIAVDTIAVDTGYSVVMTMEICLCKNVCLSTTFSATASSLAAGPLNFLEVVAD